MPQGGIMIYEKHWIAESFIMKISLDLLHSDKAATTEQRLLAWSFHQ
jgi:hypothetical protein